MTYCAYEFDRLGHHSPGQNPSLASNEGITQLAFSSSSQKSTCAIDSVPSETRSLFATSREYLAYLEGLLSWSDQVGPKSPTTCAGNRLRRLNSMGAVQPP